MALILGLLSFEKNQIAFHISVSHLVLTNKTYLVTFFNDLILIMFKVIDKGNILKKVGKHKTLQIPAPMQPNAQLISLFRIQTTKQPTNQQ